MTTVFKKAVLKEVRARIKIAKREIMLAGSIYHSKKHSVIWYQKKRKLRRLRDKLVANLAS